METIIIAALAKNRVIGNKGKIPWHFPKDLRRFRELTLHHPVIMGRNTYESIIERNGKPLDQRLNIVLSKHKEFVGEGVITVHSIKDALEEADQYQRAYIIGGENVYEQTINLANRMELTELKEKYEGDAHFPNFNQSEDWTQATRIWMKDFDFVTYTRKK